MAKNKSWKLLANILTPSSSFAPLYSPPFLLFASLPPPFCSLHPPLYVNASGANTCSQARWGATMRISRILWQMFSNRIRFGFAFSSSFSIFFLLLFSFTLYANVLDARTRKLFLCLHCCRYRQTCCCCCWRLTVATKRRVALIAWCLCCSSVTLHRCSNDAILLGVCVIVKYTIGRGGSKEATD